MKRSDSPVSACRHCRHYVPEGRRGGTCGQLNDVLVQGSWKACSLASPVFAANWQFERIVTLHSEPIARLPVPISVTGDFAPLASKRVCS
jgi:hypothetical protein